MMVKISKERKSFEESVVPLSLAACAALHQRWQPLFQFQSLPKDGNFVVPEVEGARKPAPQYADLDPGEAGRAHPVRW